MTVGIGRCDPLGVLDQPLPCLVSAPAERQYRDEKNREERPMHYARERADGTRYETDATVLEQHRSAMKLR